MNKPLKNRLVGDRAEIELHDRTPDPQYQGWVKMAQLYGTALLGDREVLAENRPSNGILSRILTVRIDGQPPSEMGDTLKAAYHALVAGDMLVIDIPKGIERDLLSRLLFAAWISIDRWSGRVARYWKRRTGPPQ